MERLRVLLLFPKLNFHFDGFFTIAGEIVAVGEGAGGGTEEADMDVCTGEGLVLVGDEDEAALESMVVNEGTLVEASDPDGVLNTGKDGGSPDDDWRCASASVCNSERGRGPVLWETLTEEGRPFPNGSVYVNDELRLASRSHSLSGCPLFDKSETARLRAGGPGASDEDEASAEPR